jgi:coenzyme F420-reducing hydrogenase alpha subunit
MNEQNGDTAPALLGCEVEGALRAFDPCFHCTILPTIATIKQNEVAHG